ncbi:MAG: hypothetical protein Q4F40_09975, partial [Akkermansia sp.]|nr:hypothetical protein [Akkermansia sp.]
NRSDQQNFKISKFIVDYQQLLRAAFCACYNQNPDYRAALAATTGMNLDHSIGKNDPTQTVLTIAEFTDILTWLRDGRVGEE